MNKQGCALLLEIRINGIASIPPLVIVIVQYEHALGFHSFIVSHNDDPSKPHSQVAPVVNGTNGINGIK